MGQRKRESANARKEAKKTLYVAKLMNTKDIIIIPSSINEVIVIPKNATEEMELVANMIKEVNATEVAPEEVLFDEPFTYTVK